MSNSSPARRARTTTVVALDELKRREDLESLRKYLISESCFPAQKDPEHSVISMEELKKLARIWKLNERRNFWKNHSERNDMVAALLQHAEQNQNYMTKKINLETSVDYKTEYKAAPPTDLRPSITRTTASITPLKNYCGIKVMLQNNVFLIFLIYVIKQFSILIDQLRKPNY